MIDAELGEFVDSLTLEFRRTYPCSRQVLWSALIDDASAWFAVRPVTIEAFTGGTGTFGPKDAPVRSAIVAECIANEVLAFHHPDVPEGGALRFELNERDHGTELVFTQRFRPGGTFQAGTREGTDFPAGTELPWRPGFVAGFHLMFDNLAHVLGGPPVPDPEGQWRDVLVPAYRDHIRQRLGEARAH